MGLYFIISFFFIVCVTFWFSLSEKLQFFYYYFLPKLSNKLEKLFNFFNFRSIFIDILDNFLTPLRFCFLLENS